MLRLVKEILESHGAEDTIHVTVDYSSTDINMLMDALYSGDLPTGADTEGTFAQMCEDFEIFKTTDISDREAVHTTVAVSSADEAIVIGEFEIVPEIVSTQQQDIVEESGEQGPPAPTQQEIIEASQDPAVALLQQEINDASHHERDPPTVIVEDSACFTPAAAEPWSIKEQSSLCCVCNETALSHR